MEPLLKHCGLHVFAESYAEYIHNLAQRNVGTNRLDYGGHRIFCAFGDAAQVIERAAGSSLVAFVADALETCDLSLLALVIDVERRDLDMLMHRIVIDTDDNTL